MKFAICDDNAKAILHVSSLLQFYRQEKNVELSYNLFNNGVELLSLLRRNQYDALFLDVMMPVMDGMQIAREIRRINKEVKIIFLTSSSDFAVESYKVQAYNYILKPITAETLFPVLDSLFAELQRPAESLLIKTRSSVYRIPFDQIEYLEVNAKKLYFALADNSTREVTGSLSNFEDVLLSRSEFVKVHRSYIANLQWVQTLASNQISTRCGRHLPVSRTAYPKVREAYLQCAFNEKGN